MKFVLVALIGFIAAIGASAAPCLVDTLDNYLLLPAAGCSIGDFNFKTFSFLNVAGPAIAASDITVTPFLAPGEMGLRFESAAFTLSGGLSSTHQLDYIIDAPPIIVRLDNIMARRFSFAESDVASSVVPPAVATVTTDICATVGIVCPPGTLDTVTVFDDGVAPVLTGSAPVPPSNFITVQNRIELDASLGGTADFQSITNREVLLPEPGTSVLVAAGGLLAWWRRKRS